MAAPFEMTLDPPDNPTRVVMRGQIDERAKLNGLAEQVADQVVFDLERVTFINSVGVREWIKLMRGLERRGVKVELERCSEPIVHQLNMIVEAMGSAQVRSFFAPYQCDDCGYEGSMHLDVANHAAELRAMQAPTVACPECGGSMELTEIPERYLLFLEGQ